MIPAVLVSLKGLASIIFALNIDNAELNTSKPAKDSSLTLPRVIPSNAAVEPSTDKLIDDFSVKGKPSG